MTWDPAQYLKFADERLRPALDLLARVPAAAPEVVVDLGCGAGNLTPRLRERWPRARVVGVDSSEEMLSRARADHPRAELVRADLAAWRPERPVDVLFSNATLHWLPDHETLFPRLLEHVAPGGWFAVQMPRNFAAPSHACVRDVVLQGPWRDALAPLLRPASVAAPGAYWRILRGGTSSLEIWETEYLQALPGADPVAEYVKGSFLKPFLDRLEGPERAAFEADYRARVRAAYPPEADGTTLFPFRRLFLVARRR